MRIYSPYWSRCLLIASLLLTLLASNRLNATAAGRVKMLQAEATPTPRAQSTSGQSSVKPPAAEDIGDELGDQGAGAVSSLREVRTAVIQIEAKGTFRSPEEGMQYNVSGAGSGFIIDPAGIAVTNNHVVTGAALLKVYIAGEEKPRNARVLGVSECSDLAVIDIEGDGFPYLAWYEEPLEAGLEIYAAGFPLGDPEYTLTDGIIAKAEADGETDWASVDHVVEHTAPIKPGNSGGPLVTGDGQVVAVNYAGADDADQFYAIASDIALPIIEQLRNGENVDTIGLNGQVMEIGDEGLQGIWVASVASGSPADTAGVKPGDVLLMMEGILVAEDGTLSQYCDILRSHSPDEVMSIEVIRYDSDQWLEGQLNGRALTLKTEIGEEGTEESSSASAADDQSAAATYESFAIIENEAGTLSMEVPEEWEDTQDTEWVLDDEPVGIRLVAAPNVDDFMNSWDTPGIILSVSESLVEDYDAEGVLDFSDYAEQCDKEDRYELENEYYTGYYDVWNNCGDAGSTNYIVALLPPEGNYIAKIEATAVTDADVDALNHVIASFVFNGSQAPTTSNEDLGSDIFDIVDTSGMAYDYVFIRQPALSALVPENWTEIEPGDWESDGEVIGSTLDVAADLEAYSDWTTEPGITVYTATGLNEDLDLEALLDETDYSEACTLDKREKHSHTIYGHTYSGAYDIWTDCNDENNILIHLVAASEPADQVVFIDFLLVNEDDVDALDVFLQSFLVENGEETTETPTQGSGGTTEIDTSQYQTLVDDSGLLSVSVPNDWSDTQSGNWVKDDEEIGVYVAAAPNLDDFFADWNTAGIFYGASTVLAETMNAAEYLDESSFSNDCTLDARFDYDDAVFSGVYDLWTDCGDEGTLFINLAVTPKENTGLLLLVQVALPTGTGQEVLEQILATFTLNEADNAAADLTVEEPMEEENPIAAGTAVVRANALNVRTGPGTEYSRIAGVNRDDQLAITGQVNNCAWLQIIAPDGTVGWVSGGAQYVSITADCADIPAVQAPPPPSNSASSGSSGAAAGSSSGVPAGKGCYTFQNQLGAELNITFTKADKSWNKTFKVPRGGEHKECFDPGKYTYTLDAPPPWGSTNGELTVNAGDNYYFPITPSE